MNNLFKHIVGVLVFTNFATAQVRFRVDSNNYLGVSSYSGATSNNEFNRVAIEGNGNINISNWKVTVQVLSPMTTGGKTFPPEKLVLQPTGITVQSTPQNTPTLAQIGVLNETYLNLIPVFIIPQSGAPIYNAHPNNGYYNMNISFKLVVEGGAYLTDLKGQTYRANVQFTLYDGNNTFLASAQNYYDINVSGWLSGTPPVQNSFSLTVNGGAQNGTLTLQSRSDYEYGTSVTYNNGLTVNTNAAYQVMVNASSGTPHFSYNGNNIDLDVLKVQLSGGGAGVTDLNPVILSTSAQRIAKGNTTGNSNLNFNVEYSINLAQRDKLLYAYKDKQQSETTYTTTLQYTILAQ